MNLTIPTKPLLAALESASIAVGRSLPACSCALVECESVQVRVTCDNLDARITATADGAECEKPFKFVTGVRLLKYALRGESAEITLIKDGLTIKSGGVTTLKTLPTKEFPAKWKDVPRHPVDAVELLTAIRVSSACTDPTDESQKSCLYWDTETSRMVGTNGRAVAAFPMSSLTDEAFMLPAVQAKLLLSCFGADDELSVGVSGGVLSIAAQGRTAFFRMREGRFFNYAAHLPKSNPFATLDRDVLIGALKSLAPFSDSFQKVHVETDEKTWTLTAAHQGDESSVTIDVVKGVKSEPFGTSINCLLSTVQGWACDEVEATLDGVLLIHPVGKPEQVGMVTLYREDA